MAQIVGPILTVATLVFTIDFANKQFENANRALLLSEQSMKIGQRAYVVLRNGEFRLSPVRGGGNGEGSTEYRFTVQVHNLGRTPASLVDMKLEYHGGKALYRSNSGTRNPPEQRFTKLIPLSGQIGPGDYVLHSEREFFSVHRQYAEYAAIYDQIPRNQLVDAEILAFGLAMRGSLRYKDVFGEGHTTDWCWEILYTRFERNCTADDSESIVDWSAFIKPQ
jgi:hypothetical protein